MSDNPTFAKEAADLAAAHGIFPMDKHTFSLPEIPEAYVTFAKAAADLAAAHGMDKFEMTFRPRWRDHPFDRRIHGDMKISFADVDGRGRPCRNLSIQVESTLTLDIVSNPESSN